jgi:hypothetical protein
MERAPAVLIELEYARDVHVMGRGAGFEIESREILTGHGVSFRQAARGRRLLTQEEKQMPCHSYQHELCREIKRVIVWRAAGSRNADQVGPVSMTQRFSVL